MAVRSCPKAKTLPESGLTRPSAVLSSTVLPLPAAPRITRDSPSSASKETSDSAATSSKDTRDVFEPQNRRSGLSGIRLRPGYTKILVIMHVQMKIRTVAATMACVVARPTPCVPPVVRRP